MQYTLGAESSNAPYSNLKASAIEKYSAEGFNLSQAVTDLSTQAVSVKMISSRYLGGGVSAFTGLKARQLYGTMLNVHACATAMETVFGPVGSYPKDLQAKVATANANMKAADANVDKMVDKNGDPWSTETADLEQFRQERAQNALAEGRLDDPSISDEERKAIASNAHAGVYDTMFDEGNREGLNKMKTWFTASGVKTAEGEKTLGTGTEPENTGMIAAVIAGLAAFFFFSK